MAGSCSALHASHNALLTFIFRIQPIGHVMHAIPIARHASTRHSTAHRVTPQNLSISTRIHQRVCQSVRQTLSSKMEYVWSVTHHVSDAASRHQIAQPVTAPLPSLCCSTTIALLDHAQTSILPISLLWPVNPVRLSAKPVRLPPSVRLANQPTIGSTAQVA